MKMKQHTSPDPLAWLSGTNTYTFLLLTLTVIVGGLGLIVTALYYACVKPIRSNQGRGAISLVLRRLGLNKQNSIDYRLDQQLVTEVFRELPFLVSPVSSRAQYDKQRLLWEYIWVKLLNNKTVNGGGQHINRSNFNLEIMKERFIEVLPAILMDSRDEYILQKHPYVFAYDDYLNMIEETLTAKFGFVDARERQVQEGSSRSTTGTSSAAHATTTTATNPGHKSIESFDMDTENQVQENDPIEHELTDGTDPLKPETRAKVAHLKSNVVILELMVRLIRFPDHTPAIKWSSQTVALYLRNLLMENLKENEYELLELSNRLRDAMGNEDEMAGDDRAYELRTLV